MAPPRRSLRKHVAMRDDNSTISSGLSSGAGLTYTMPSTYRTKSQKPSPVQKAQTKQLSKLPLPPPRRPRRTRSSRSMGTTTDSGTVASGTTYTSRVSKVSIKPREPVLKSNDPLSRAMQDKIGDAEENATSKKDAGKKEPPKKTEKPSAEHLQKSSGIKHKGFAPLTEGDDEPNGVQVAQMEEGIPTQVISTKKKDGPVVLPPPPPLDSLETYSLGTNDFITKYNNPQRGSGCRNWRLIICIVSVLLLAVIAAAVVSVLLLLDKNNETAASNTADGNTQMTSTPTQVPVPAPTTAAPPTAAPTMPSAFAPIASPVLPPTDNDVPNLERLIDFFSDQDVATELDLSNLASPQYRAMEWLESDAAANQYTFASSQARILQRGALAIFYYSTLGDVQWETSTLWLDSSASECTWYGVVCDTPDTPTKLELEKNNLGGRIPREVGLLTGLQEILLNENELGGTIPSHVGQLASLKKLELTTNSLTGSLPEAFSQLASLEALQLNENSLTGSIPDSIGSLSSLQLLWLMNNNMVGSIPTTVGSLIRMKYLLMGSNQLTGSLPTELGILADCEFMAFQDNNLSGPIPDTLGNAENLKGLTLKNNALTGTVPATLGLLFDLNTLDLDGNELVGAIPSEICALPDVGVNNKVVADCEEPDPEITCDCCSNCPFIWGGAP